MTETYEDKWTEEHKEVRLEPLDGKLKEHDHKKNTWTFRRERQHLPELSGLLRLLCCAYCHTKFSHVLYVHGCSLCVR